MSVNSIENMLVILTKQTIDIFLKSESPADVMALYTFYYYTAKWQETNQAKCTTGYAAAGLRWSEQKVRKTKKMLADIGLIEDVKTKDDSGKISGHYIKLNYIVKQSTINENHTMDLPQYGKTHSVAERETNALSSNILNASSYNNKNALSDDIKNIIDYLNLKAHTKYMVKSKNTQKYIKARLSEGYTVDDFKTVIDKKCSEWIGTQFEQYLRPATLFGTKFENYLNANYQKEVNKGGDYTFDTSNEWL